MKLFGIILADVETIVLNSVSYPRSPCDRRGHLVQIYRGRKQCSDTRSCLWHSARRLGTG